MHLRRTSVSLRFRMLLGHLTNNGNRVGENRREIASQCSHLFLPSSCAAEGWEVEVRVALLENHQKSEDAASGLP